MFETPVPQTARDAILQKACAQHLVVEVASIRQKPVLSFKGPLLASSGERGHILVEVPAGVGPASMMHSGDEVRVMLTAGGELYGFNALIMGQSRAADGAVSVQGVLTLSYPRAMMKIQRRKSPRAKLSALSAIKVMCIAPKADSSGAESDGTVRFTAIMNDISAGGIGLRIGLKQARLAQTGRRWTVAFMLPGIAQPINLAAEVRFVGKGVRVNEAFVGVRFVNWEGATAGRKAVSDISDFVARTLREGLKKTSGLE